MKENEIYDAAEVIDSLLGGDDGSILAAMAHYKASLLSLFGREGIVSLMRNAVDVAPHVTYFSQRSRREIDPARPTVNLRVDHERALAENEPLKAEWGFRPYDSEDGLLALKAAVVHHEVCRAMSTGTTPPPGFKISARATLAVP